MDSKFAVINWLKLSGDSRAELPTMASNVQHLFVVSNPDNPEGWAKYVLSLFNVTPSGTLQDVNDTTIDPSLTQDAQVPLIVASPSDVYVALEDGHIMQNAATIFDFPVNGDVLGQPYRISIPTLTNLEDMTVLGKNQLLLLYSDGSIESLQMNTGNPTHPWQWSCCIFCLNLRFQLAQMIIQLIKRCLYRFLICRRNHLFYHCQVQLFWLAQWPITNRIFLLWMGINTE